jgi:uncharacterized protein
MFSVMAIRFAIEPGDKYLDRGNKSFGWFSEYCTTMEPRSMQITPSTLERIVACAREYGAKKVILFGSALDDPEHARDIDIACDIHGWNIFAFAGRIEEELRLLIDVVPLTPSNPIIEYISKHGKILYDERTAS